MIERMGWIGAYLFIIFFCYLINNGKLKDVF